MPALLCLPNMVKGLEVLCPSSELMVCHCSFAFAQQDWNLSKRPWLLSPIVLWLYCSPWLAAIVASWTQRAAWWCRQGWWWLQQPATTKTTRAYIRRRQNQRCVEEHMFLNLIGSSRGYLSFLSSSEMTWFAFCKIGGKRATATFWPDNIKW